MIYSFDKFSDYDLIVSDVDCTIVNGNLLENYLFDNYSIDIGQIWWRLRPLLVLILTIINKKKIGTHINDYLSKISDSSIKIDYKCKGLAKVIFVTNCWPLFYATNGDLLGRPIIATGIIKYLFSCFNKKQQFHRITLKSEGVAILFVGDREHDKCEGYDFFKV